MKSIINPLKNLNTTDRLILKSVKKFSREQLPNYLNNKNEYRNLYKEMGKLGILGCTFKTYNFPGVSKKMYGLISKELEYIDSSFRGAFSVQSSLVIGSIINYGTKDTISNYIGDLK